MWLLPLFARFSTFMVRRFYRFSVSGGEVPSTGPVLLVANHPNSLLDPGCVAAAAGRPVRFLAKAPLFTDPAVGWMVRGVGAIPVYRKQDDPTAMGQNEKTFEAVHAALGEGGSAVGIFPEGRSHNDPSIGQLKTGAARMLLGAERVHGVHVPVVPLGLTFRDKSIFRSKAQAVVGEAIDWSDLAGRGPDDVEAVRTLTDRIDDALRRLTINVDQWEDAPVVACAEAIRRLEFEQDPQQSARLERTRTITAALADYRERDPERLDPLYRSVARYQRVLESLGLEPEDLDRPLSLVRVALRNFRFLLFFVLMAPLALVGSVLFWPPYRLVGFLANREVVPLDVKGTFKLLVGGLMMIGWIVVLSLAAGWWLGWPIALVVLLLLPPLGLLTQQVLDRWELIRSEARRQLLLGSRRRLRERLLIRRGELARELEQFRLRWVETLEGDDRPSERTIASENDSEH